ncbi:hypothetical protein FAM09_12410 [Niastella caeni]|uniref:Uncharacterized protein n=1 Tax=Niastella caeni TaxID=2569763 RepID=A0A4S8HX18_9BACT|nr:hypothetical protein [Niastella caeni]THU39309.1 hypothetical protein FAM09_12410 [Niastella caeni]
MAEFFAPFLINRTIGKLTFYQMEGKNFVRKKSSLTRKRVLHSPQFARTRHYAGLMAKASRIGSLVYNALPEYWRQGWMYRSFTGEALTMLKAGKNETEIQQVLWLRYVESLVNKQPKKHNIVPLPVPPKRAYQKKNSAYWENKTIKSARRKARKQQALYYAGLLARASKIGSKLYAAIPCKYRSRSCFQQLTAFAMQLLKDEWDESEIVAELLPTLPQEQSDKCLQLTPKMIIAGLVHQPKGQYYFITSLHKRPGLTPARAIFIRCILC